MAKRKKKSRPKSKAAHSARSATPPSRKLLSRLVEVDRLMADGQWNEADAALQALAQTYPKRTEVLRAQVNLAYEVSDVQAYQQYLERLLALEANDLEVRWALTGAYLTNGHLWLALSTLRPLLSEDPNHPRAAEMHEALERLEAGLDELVQEENLAEESALELLALDDQTRAQLGAGNFAAAKVAATKLLAIDPDFVPALNNLSQTEFMLGSTHRGIELAEQVLTQDPDNFQALANLARFQFLTDQADAAQETMARLLPLQSDNDDIWLKKAEALTYLDRNEDVLAIAAEAEAAGYFKRPQANPLLHHYRAAAAARTGDEHLARQAWQAALALDPHLSMAQENLADLDLPIGQREGAWALPATAWISQRAYVDFQQLSNSVQGGNARTLERALRRYMRRHPEVLPRIPALLERGDPRGRRLAATLALYGDTPELHAALRDFVSGPAGPDQFRLELAQVATRDGILQPGMITMCIDGEQQEIVQQGFEIHEEPMQSIPAAIDELYHDAYAALESGDYATAEELFLQAIEIAPDQPQLFNNLALVYDKQGRKAEVDALVARITDEFPDYFFGISAQANQATAEGDFERAHELLMELSARRQLHISEFRALCTSYANLLIAQNMSDGAERWLDMWEQIEPEHPEIPIWRVRARAAHAPKPLRKLLKPFTK